MTRRSTVRLMLMIVMMCLVGSAGFADAVGDFEELTLEIATSSTRILPMEAVALLVTLSNKTEHPVLGHDFVDGPYFKVYLARDGEPYECVDTYPNVYNSVIVKTRELAAGYRYACKKYLWFAHTPECRGKALFRLPGNYLLKTVSISMT